MLPGLVGLVQATEAVKLLLNIGETLVGRLLMYDSLAMKFREFKSPKDPGCALCGLHPTILELEKALPESGATCAMPSRELPHVPAPAVVAPAERRH